jgi:diacylglycerol kinase family enzyme
MPDPRAFLNTTCGNAEAAREALATAGFELETVAPDDLVAHFRDAVARGVRRMIVAGGDGTIAAAAAIAARSNTEIAILPGGTLNHFAKDNGIPTDLGEAARLAGAGTVKAVDLGYLGDRVFLNTSSIGLYVSFVRVRERLEKRLGYRLASMLAAIRIFLAAKTIAVRLEIDGQARIYRTPLLFIAVGERELQAPALGSRVANGRRGLHVMVVRGRGRARLFAFALAAIAKGTRQVARTLELDSFIVDRCSVDLRDSSALVALDGELHRMQAPLEYRIERDALRLVVASPGSAGQENKPRESGTQRAS